MAELEDLEVGSESEVDEKTSALPPSEAAEARELDEVMSGVPELRADINACLAELTRNRSMQRIELQEMVIRAFNIQKRILDLIG